MVHPLGKLCCILGILLVVFGEDYRDDGSFHVIRGTVRDRFVNCARSDSCATTSCGPFNAVCSSNGCRYCLCNDNSTTYLPNNERSHGKCTQDSAVERDTGCFNSCGRHSIHTFDTSCIENCIEKVTIRTFDVFFPNKECTLNWSNSSFSVDNQYWKPIEKFKNDFSLIYNNTARTQALHIKLELEAYERWAGALLKLHIECRQANYSSENFCVIFKFTGKYTPYTGTARLTETLVNSITNTTTGSRTEMGMPGDQYLASTIALSAILFLVFVFLGLGIFLLLRNNDRHSSAEQTIETDPATGTTREETEETQLTV